VEYIGVAVPIQCRHCENAPCMAACPSNAIKKEDGIVVVEKEKCIGCKACMMVCPFGAMSIDAECGVLKCDLCGGNPACVNACKTGALQYGDVLELVKERRRKYLKNLCLK
jgi:carbon-monoxide dehydrogenase iron sulfur subunit